MTKPNFKKSAMTVFQRRHRYYVTKNCHKNSFTNSILWAPPNQNFWLCQCCVQCIIFKWILPFDWLHKGKEKRQRFLDEQSQMVVGSG